MAGTALPTVAAIKRAVAAEYGVDPARFEEPRPVGRRAYQNTWDIAHPRQVAMTLAVRLTDHSYPRIGHFFGGRDHSTVYSSCAAVEKRRRADPKLHNMMRRVTLALVSR